MICTDEDALICDFAETYGIFDYKALPIMTLATLAAGLKGDARIVRLLTGQKMSTQEVLLAGILDRLSYIAWTKTKDAAKGRNRPQSVLNEILDRKPKSEIEIFESGDDFMRRLNELREG